MQTLESYVKLNTKLELVIHEMFDLVSRVEIAHAQYVEYVEHYDHLERSTLESFARGVVEDSSLSVKGMIPRINALVSGPTTHEFKILGNRGLLTLIAADLEVTSFSLCFSF